MSEGKKTSVTIMLPRNKARFFTTLALLVLVLLPVASEAAPTSATITVQGQVRDDPSDPNKITATVNVAGFRWLLEEDNTNWTVPGLAVSNSVGLDIHKSHAPVIAKGRTDSATASIPIPDPAKRYFVSILPDKDFSLGGAALAPNQNAAIVLVHKYPIPTAQISVLVFEDHNPINNVFDPTETGLSGWQVLVFDAGGQIVQDAFGNPIQGFDINGNTIGPAGTILTGADGRVFVKNLPPGKYGVRAVPPGGQSTDWVQTATIEGTPGVDAWVKANEPPYFVEGFGTAFTHVFIGFVNPAALPGFSAPGSGSITGRNIYTHFPRPSTGAVQFFEGPPVSECWVGLNDPVTQRGLAAVPCNGNSEFSFTGVPDGTYQLVTWDKPLDALFGIHTVTLSGGNGGNLGNVLSFRWFGTLKGMVFTDKNQNGFQDPGEPGIGNQAVNIRFRDGSFYQGTVTDPSGEYTLSEVFPFFKWLVTEVDFARFKATGMTTAVDYGGEIPAENGWTMPSFGELNPQPQTQVNANTGNNLSRTEVGPTLTQALQLYLNQTNVIDWGKADYTSGVQSSSAASKTRLLRSKRRLGETKPTLGAYVEENGGISGIVYYATTRAEDDPAYAGAEPWEPGIPRVQVNLYEDFNDDGIPDGPPMATAYTDSWDDNPPTGCIQDSLVIHGQQVKKCYDNYSTWNQVRPGVFDGGYAFGPDLPKGVYIVEVIPPNGYELLKEEDKNVDFGDGYKESLQAGLGALPPACVGPLRTVPPYLTLFLDEQIEAPFAGEQRPLCNRKRVVVEPGKNAAADFFLFTEVPKAARTVGFVNNDLAAEFNSTSPIFGEKASPSWLPISFQDWAGNEITRVYVDEFGSYNALLPSTFTANAPIPSGMSPNMVNVCLNYPLMTDPADPTKKTLDPFYNPDFSQSCWTFDFWPGKTTYLDTPIVPLAAFVGPPSWGLDVEPLDGTPVIHSVSGPSGGPWVSAPGQRITLYSLGRVNVPNPDRNPSLPGSTAFISRNYGFGTNPGTVTLGGVALANVVWTDYTITGNVPLALGNGSHQLLVTNSSGVSNDLGVTVHIENILGGPLRVNPGESIQAVIDDPATLDGSLILVAPGSYSELIIMNKPVRLQGWGAGSTTINASPFPVEKLQAWRDKIAGLVPDPNQFLAKEGPGVMVLGGGSFLSNPSRIDGFTITGSLSGGGVYVNNDVSGLNVSNNRIKGNKGSYGGGVTLGTPDLTGANNNNVAIQYNQIVKNSGRTGGGGVSLYDGSTATQVKNNFISGNFSSWHGGGAALYGLVNNTVIQTNKILFNEVFFGGAVGGEGGGIYISGGPPALPGGLTPGAGNVTVNANLIQGNLAGAGKGGGIRVNAFNGADVDADPNTPANWYGLNIYNNMIVNNVAAYGGGGIALQDLAKGEIIHNTIANNNSTSTAAAAFPNGQITVSAAEGAGIVSGAHSAPLAAAFDLSPQTFSNPTLTNNIIWHNQSYTWNGNLAAQEKLVPFTGPQAGYWDLQVFGTTGTLTTTNCLLSTSPGNPNLVQDYANALQSAIVIDEGGNSISVRYRASLLFDPADPLKKSNYHLLNTASSAYNTGASIVGLNALLGFDYDFLGRPYLATNPDIGAHELRQ